MGALNRVKGLYRCEKCGKYVESSTHCGRRAVPVLEGWRRLRLSKLMSALLRHLAGRQELKLSSDGWIGLKELADYIKRWKPVSYGWVSEEHLLAVARADAKGRFEDLNGKIRARYGHSVPVNLKLPEDLEVKTLYHGTVERALKAILREGIKPMKRRKVHLTSSLSDAIETAKRRRGRAVILEVNAEKLRAKGFRLLKAGKTVYVTDYVPPDCVTKLDEGGLG